MLAAKCRGHCCSSRVCERVSSSCPEAGGQVCCSYSSVDTEQKTPSLQWMCVCVCVCVCGSGLIAR